MMAFPGWTWEYIDDMMTLPRLYAIFKHWESRPPLHWMVAQFLGIKRKSQDQSGASLAPDEGDVKALAESLMSGPLLDG